MLKKTFCAKVILVAVCLSTIVFSKPIKHDVNKKAVYNLIERIAPGNSTKFEIETLDYR